MENFSPYLKWFILFIESNLVTKTSPHFSKWLYCNKLLTLVCRNVDKRAIGIFLLKKSNKSNGKKHHYKKRYFVRIYLYEAIKCILALTRMICSEIFVVMNARMLKAVTTNCWMNISTRASITKWAASCGRRLKTCWMLKAVTTNCWWTFQYEIPSPSEQLRAEEDWKRVEVLI